MLGMAPHRLTPIDLSLLRGHAFSRRLLPHRVSQSGPKTQIERMRVTKQIDFGIKKNQNLSKTLPAETLEDYNYQNANDVDNFCPAAEQDASSDYLDADCNDFGHSRDGAEEVAGGETAGLCFAGDNLLQPPPKVARFEMPQMKTAKRINIKQLKSAMWNLLSVEEEAADNDVHNRTIVGNKSFKEVYQHLPSRISADMAKDLSVHVAFFCLLDLANEKGLFLKSNKDMGDVTILMADS